MWGAIMGGLAVALGAFGAHAFKAFLIESGRSDTFELAVRYQFYHALALLAAGLVMGPGASKWIRYSSASFLLGILVFSGSLYALCLTGFKGLGAITPIGGMFFIAGWILFALGVTKK
jgi:uncharacterized membrane protein YgdD (TMEM256/DUF423 family)